MIKAVLFDFYGVLLTNRPQDTFAQFGGDAGKHQKEIMDINNAYDSGFIDRDELHSQLAEMVGVSMKEWREAREDGYWISEDLQDFIRSLRAKKAVLSNTSMESFKLAAHNLDLEMFNDIILSVDVGLIKPDPRIFKLAARRLSVEPGECVFIDDSQHNLVGAEDVGMQTIWYQNYQKMKKDIQEALSE